MGNLHFYEVKHEDTLNTLPSIEQCTTAIWKINTLPCLFKKQCTEKARVTRQVFIFKVTMVYSSLERSVIATCDAYENIFRLTFIERNF